MIFRPKNSLILAYDHLTDEGANEMISQVDEVRQYYSPTKLTTIVEDLNRGKVRQSFAILFKNPRKSVFLRAIPKLLDRNIPFTLAVRADCVGMNRLPREEELDLYKEGYPEKSREFEMWKERIWTSPSEVDTYLIRCRKESGPLPVDRADPTQFFVTWGKILEIPEESREIALGIWFSPSLESLFQAEKQFIETQIGENLALGHATHSNTHLTNCGLKGIVTPRSGAIEKKTSPFDLPQWKLSSADDKI